MFFSQAILTNSSMDCLSFLSLSKYAKERRKIPLFRFLNYATFLSFVPDRFGRFWTISYRDGVLFDITNKYCLSLPLSLYIDQQKTKFSFCQYWPTSKRTTEISGQRWPLVKIEYLFNSLELTVHFLTENFWSFYSIIFDDLFKKCPFRVRHPILFLEIRNIPILWLNQPTRRAISHPTPPRERSVSPPYP